MKRVGIGIVQSVQWAKDRSWNPSRCMKFSL